MLMRADVLVMSSDIDAGWMQAAGIDISALTQDTILCDITATGASGARAGAAYSDVEIQALTGLMDTTGFPDGAPTAIGIPYAEISAGMYAAFAIVAALRDRACSSLVQDIEVALYDCAASALTTFLPHVFAGRNPRRVGNRHSSSAPWNAYPTKNGWLMICTSTQDQWIRLRGLIGKAELEQPAYATLAGRVEHVDALDALIGEWTRTLTTEACLAACGAADIPAGPIVALAGLAEEPNVRFRGIIANAHEAAGDSAAWRPAPAFRVSAPEDAGEEDKRGVRRIRQDRRLESEGPFKGIRVIEIGQYTTAPLVGKHLAALGAEVIKVEPPEGDVTRGWAHGQGGTSYFFAWSNTDKRSVVIDLKTAEGKEKFSRLVASADILVENLRPGALARLGFDADTLASLNPRLIYCAISGFGTASAYPQRPAFDTVIQAMSGIMDLTRAEGIPAKAGISAADILSGQLALFAVAASLLKRDVSEQGSRLDVSMQDVAVWATHPMWKREAATPSCSLLSCSDGHIVAAASAAELAAATGPHSLSRDDAIQVLSRRGIRAVPVKSVSELAQDPHFRLRGLGIGRDDGGRFWPVPVPPYRLRKCPLPNGRVPSELGADGERIFAGGGTRHSGNRACCSTASSNEYDDIVIRRRRMF
jgi:crotonobetainyl-CoA:carnitine CoA-transferase CaiB-like acyl-CoA transferase